MSLSIIEINYGHYFPRYFFVFSSLFSSSLFTTDFIIRDFHPVRFSDIGILILLLSGNTAAVQSYLGHYWNFVIDYRINICLYLSSILYLY